jgi:hypothetical protein
MFDDKFEPVRYGSVPTCVISGIWSSYADEHGLVRGSAIELIHVFTALARSKNRNARRYGFKCITGVRLKS